MLTKAIENYKLAAEKETDAKMKKLSMDYLVAAYGPDKLNDPAEAEGIVQKMIQLDPSDTTNYFVLAQIYEDAGELAQAEAMLLKAKEAQPKDPSVYQRLAGYYQRQAEFEKLIEAVIAACDPRAAKSGSPPGDRELLLGRRLSQHPPQ